MPISDTVATAATAARLPTNDGTCFFTVQVVESQRRYVLTGWTGRARFPLDPYEWADSKGQCSRPTREVDYELPKGGNNPFPCEWVTDWEIYVGTDAEDWYKGGGMGGEDGEGRSSKLGKIVGKSLSPLLSRRKKQKKTAEGSGGESATSAHGSSSANNSEVEAAESSSATAAAGKEESSMTTPTGATGGCGANAAVSKSADAALLKFTRFDDDGWEYAFDYHRTFRSKQSATMSWVRRRFWRRTFVVRDCGGLAPSEVEEEIPFPDRFRLCLLENGGFDAAERARRLAAVAEYLQFRPMPRVTDYKVGLRRLGVKLYKPADVAPRSRSQSADEKEGGDSARKRGSATPGSA